MASFRLLLAELRFRKLNFALALLAVAAAAALVVAGLLLVEGYRRETAGRLAVMEAQSHAAVDAQTKELALLDDETRKLMLTMGFNLLIVHKDTNMADLWAEDFAAKDMPQEYVERLAQSKELEHVRHLVATLQQKIKWQERTVLLVGYLKETPQTHFQDKKPMGHAIEPGTVFLGYELWAGAKLKAGDSVEVLGRPFRVAKTLPERGSKEDITLAMNIADAQSLLGKPGKVNHILAIGCQCEGDRLGTIRKELERTLPETKITEHQSIAQARAEQRDKVAATRIVVLASAKAQREQLIEQRSGIESSLFRLTTFGTPWVILLCGLIVGLLALVNVRERRPEIGLMRAIGKTSLYIAGLFLAKSLLLGLAGGAIGYGLGLLVARLVGAQVYEISAGNVAAPLSLLLWTVVGAPVVCALATYLPTVSAVAQDPAVALREV
ncbi:MAG: ABC transporter permease [Planctomycetia bacterium]|nr:ABC transporter permease [Planctomycetia bacterium]